MFDASILVYKSPTVLMLEKMKDSPFVFHQTGSRYFGNNSLDSDYDFFTKNCEEARQFLIKNGFVKIGSVVDYMGIDYDEQEPAGNDLYPNIPPTSVLYPYFKTPSPVAASPNNPDNSAEVWRHAKIDVQLVDNPELKVAIQEIIKKRNLMPKITQAFGKKGAVDFWNMLYEVADVKSKMKKSDESNESGASADKTTSDSPVSPVSSVKLPPPTLNEIEKMAGDFEKNYML